MIAKGFDRLAPVYDRLARIVFGNALVQSQQCFLPVVAEARSILVLGGGTGWWLNNLLKMNPQARITFVDTSQEMIRLAKENTNANAAIDFVYGSLASVVSDRKFDAVVLYCFVDLFTEAELSNLITDIKGRLMPGALWVISDFVQEKRWHSALLRIMYLFFRLTAELKSSSLPDWRKVFGSASLYQKECRFFYSGFICSVVYRSR